MDSMMSVSRISVENESIETLFEKELSSSEDPPMEEWSSLMMQKADLMAIQSLTSHVADSGEICAKYIAASDSTVIGHPYYRYPAVEDPGIEAALFEPEPTKVYDLDGQDLYLELCDEMNVPRVNEFYKGLLKDTINLRYYGVNAKSVRSMCLALEYNMKVRRIDLTGNCLNRDAWYHLGYLLGQNRTIKELVLHQCKMGPKGLEILIRMLENINLELLDLSSNEIGNIGMLFLADKIIKGAKIKKLLLSYNEFSQPAAVALAAAMNLNVYTITHLDLSWNHFFHEKSVKELVSALLESTVLIDLNLSWNCLTGGPIAELLKIKTLEKLDLSNNRLTAQVIAGINKNLFQASSLKVLNLSFNPLQPKEAYNLVLKMNLRKIRLQTLLLDEIPVTKEFEDEKIRVLSRSYRKNAIITHGKVMKTNSLALADMRDIVMKRLNYLGNKGPKKTQIDIPVYFLTKHKTTTLMIPKQMFKEIKEMGSKIDEDLIDQLAKAFPGPRIEKNTRAIDLDKVVEYVTRVWPDAKAPVTPPPSTKPESISSKKGRGKHGQAKKGKPIQKPKEKPKEKPKQNKKK